jgi:spectinomycin phosphotransferase
MISLRQKLGDRNMLVKPPLSDQRIIDYFRTYYGIEVAALTFLPLGAGMNASVYKAGTHDQLSYFVKLKHGHHHDIGIAVVGLLHDAGIQQVILPAACLNMV